MTTENLTLEITPPAHWAAWWFKIEKYLVRVFDQVDGTVILDTEVGLSKPGSRDPIRFECPMLNSGARTIRVEVISDAPGDSRSTPSDPLVTIIRLPGAAGRIDPLPPNRETRYFLPTASHVSVVAEADEQPQTLSGSTHSVDTLVGVAGGKENVERLMASGVRLASLIESGNKPKVLYAGTGVVAGSLVQCRSEATPGGRQGKVWGRIEFNIQPGDRAEDFPGVESCSIIGDTVAVKMLRAK